MSGVRSVSVKMRRGEGSIVIYLKKPRWKMLKKGVDEFCLGVEEKGTHSNGL
jgi:hypothetical protein